MRKGLIFILGIISFFGINTVNAEEIYFEYDTNVNDIKPLVDEIGFETVNEQINTMLNYYNENFSNTYPYYLIWFHKSGLDYQLQIILTYFTEIDYNYNNIITSYISRFEYRLPLGGNVFEIIYSYNPESKKFELFDSSGHSNPIIFSVSSEEQKYNPYSYYFSNFNLDYKGSVYSDLCNSSDCFLNPNTNLNIPKLDENNNYSIHKANSDFLLEPYYLYDGNNSLKENRYTTINLNDYSYVVLSLKDYNKIPENNYSTYTNIYVKGQLCSTPVYNFGQTERKDVLTGTQVQGCTQYYNDFTMLRKYILKTDVENHAIYYLKGYDSTKENVVKVDSSIYNISYIKEEDKNNPQVNINGKIYPTLSYDSLTDTATKSEDEGYISGVVCPVGDLNCYTEHNPSNIFNDLFDKPLEALKNVWESISSIFKLISEFISLLPETMQTFLYISFTIAIVLGLLKIIL